MQRAPTHTPVCCPINAPRFQD